MNAASSPTAGDELRRYWPILLGSTIGVAFGASALPFYTGGLFIGEFEKEFGWTRTQLTGIGLIGTAMMAVIAPYAGALIDRYGVRWPAAISFLALAGAFAGISLLGGSIVAYTIIHLLQILLAAGSSPIAFTRPVNAAFNKMRGLALGVTIGGIGATDAIAPPLVAELIQLHGWRGAYQVLALIILVMAPISLVLISSRRVDTPPPRPARAISGKLPLRSWLFWRLMLAFLLVALAVAGFVTHFVPMLTDTGMPVVEAARIAGVLGVAVLVGRLGVGYIIDHVFAPYVAAALLLVSAGGIALLAAGGPTYALAGALAVGLSMGAEVDLIAYLTARYYGMSNYSRMYGVFYGAFVAGVGCSPYFIALMQAAYDSYAPPMWVSVGLLCGASLLFATAPRFEPEAETTFAPA